MVGCRNVLCNWLPTSSGQTPTIAQRQLEQAQACDINIYVCIYVSMYIYIPHVKVLHQRSASLRVLYRILAAPSIALFCTELWDVPRIWTMHPSWGLLPPVPRSLLAPLLPLLSTFSVVLPWYFCSFSCSIFRMLLYRIVIFITSAVFFMFIHHHFVRLFALFNLFVWPGSSEPPCEMSAILILGPWVFIRYTIPATNPCLCCFSASFSGKK